MRIEIDKDGILIVDGISKFCPTDSDGSSCGTWCPLFRIERPRLFVKARVTICHGVEFSARGRNFIESVSESL